MDGTTGRVSELRFLELVSDWKGAAASCIGNSRLNGVYHFAFTIWLMLFQRLESKSMQEALAEEFFMSSSSGGGVLAEWRGRSRKLSTGKVSQRTGGFARARQRIGLANLSALAGHVRSKLTLKAGSKGSIFVIDGTTVTIARTKANVEEFGLHRMEGGDLHFPRVRMVAAHDLETGIPTIPVLGTLRVGECEIAEEVVPQLPEDSTILGDRGFGIFHFVHLVQKGRKRSVVRLTDRIFKRVAGGLVAPGNWERAVTWTPSKDDLKGNEENFDTHASVPGRLLQYQINRPGYRSITLKLFTTTDLSAAELAELYLQRVQVETWIRNVKQDLGIAFINAKHPDTVRKELYVAYMAFAMVCAAMCDIATQGNVSVKRISFSYVRHALRAISLSLPHDDTNFELLWARIVNAALQVQIPIRKKHRSFPRILKRGKSKFQTNIMRNNCQKNNTNCK